MFVLLTIKVQLIKIIILVIAKISRVNAIEYPNFCDIASHDSVVLVIGGGLFGEPPSSIKVTM